MRGGRLVLVAATLATIIVFPFLMRDALHALQLPNAYAAAATADTGGRVYKNGNSNNNNGNGNGNNNSNGNGNGNSNSNNNNGNGNNNSNGNGNSNSNSNGNGNGNSNGNGNGNDNVECFDNLNGNQVSCPDNVNGNSNGNGNGNDNVPPPPPPPPPPSSSGGSSLTSNRCFSVGETGSTHIDVSGGSVDIRVVSAAPLPQDTRIRLSAVDPATVPAPTGGATFLDNFVWQMQATSPCDGGSSLSTLPGAVNLGIPYSISANKSKLQIVYLRNGAWEEVQTTPDPDPNKAFISSTVRDTGTYAVIQKP